MRTKFDIKNQNKLNRKGWNWKTKIAIKRIKIKYNIKIKFNLISQFLNIFTPTHQLNQSISKLLLPTKSSKIQSIKQLPITTYL
jgi:hypothetical protein